MDILTHCISGAAAGTVAAPFAKKGVRRTGFIALAALGGALPDIDAVSLWSRFDSTMGSFLGLSLPGKTIYSAKLWYSHHGFFHSIAAGLFWCVLLFAAIALFRKAVFRRNSVLRRADAALLAAFFCAFLLHLLCDMPTPASTWGGVRLFWPASVYVGGTGQIWWWNNYDITLIAAAAVCANILLLCVLRTERMLRAVNAAVMVCAVLLSVHQIGSRGFDFGYSGYTANYRQYEETSKNIQRGILGNRVFGMIARFDRALPFNF